MFHVPEKYRIRDHAVLGSDESFGNNGAFEIPLDKSVRAVVIASDGFGWEHVSVHVVDNGQDAVPLWEEMCQMKNLFWDEEDCVIQYHPPKSKYVNDHKYTLHLWRPIGVELPIPPEYMIGRKNNG